MKHFPRLTLLLVAAASFALSLSSAMAGEAPARLVNGALVDAKGMTLYTFDTDVAGSGKSACNGPCAALWPPAMAATTDRASGAFTIVVRDDGSRQWAYRGKPIYTYQADQKPGERAGDNVKDVWHIIKA
jgi:predicted lipoprotein with Yx(FWY)xxD motif